MGSKHIVPAIAVHHDGCFEITAYIDGLRALYTCPGLRIDLDLPDMSEICSAGQPEPAGGGIQHEAGIYGIEIFVHEGFVYRHRLRICEIRGLGIEGLVPHRHDLAGVAAAHAAARGPIDDEITVAYLHRIGSRTAAGTDGAGIPGPAVLGNEASSTCPESVVFPVTFDNGRRVMDVGIAGLRECRNRSKHDCHGSGNCSHKLFHIQKMILSHSLQYSNKMRHITQMNENGADLTASPFLIVWYKITGWDSPCPSRRLQGRCRGK